MRFRLGFYVLIVAVALLGAMGYGAIGSGGKQRGPQQSTVAAAPLAGDNSDNGGDENSSDENSSDDNSSDENSSDENSSEDNADNADNADNEVEIAAPTPTPQATPVPPTPQPAVPAPQPPPPPVVQGPCIFTLGFAHLRDEMIRFEGRDLMGACLENEHGNLNPQTGQLVDLNTLQLTANGLNVWDQPTNTMRFTNGAETWTYSKCGLQKRINTQTWAWEANPGLLSGPSPAPPPGACSLV